MMNKLHLIRMDKEINNHLYRVRQHRFELNEIRVCKIIDYCKLLYSFSLFFDYKGF